MGGGGDGEKGGLANTRAASVVLRMVMRGTRLLRGSGVVPHADQPFVMVMGDDGRHQHHDVDEKEQNRYMPPFP
jgi:hypothetical protein